MKNIVIITHNMYGGGCERVISILANWFVDNDIKCTIVTEYKCDCYYKVDKRVEFKSLLSKNNIGSKDIIPAYKNFRKMIRGINPDIVLAMPEKVNIWSVISMIGIGIPVVVSERNDPKLYPKNKIKRILRKLSYPLASGFVFQTEEARNFFPKYVQKKGTILLNPLDTKQLPKAYTGLRNNEIVSVGRLSEQKNYRLLISAFSKFHKNNPNFKLKIYGEGPLLEELQNYAKELLPKGSYLFPGKKKNVLELINNASVFVLSSNHEGVPNALIEAMALGLPVISTNCPSGGPKALITNEYNGLLVPVGNEEELAEAICRLVGDKKLSNKLGNNSVLVREKLEVNKIASEWFEYLKSVCNDKRKNNRRK